MIAPSSKPRGNTLWKGRGNKPSSGSTWIIFARSWSSSSVPSQRLLSLRQPQQGGGTGMETTSSSSNSRILYGSSRVPTPIATLRMEEPKDDKVDWNEGPEDDEPEFLLCLALLSNCANQATWKALSPDTILTSASCALLHISLAQWGTSNKFWWWPIAWVWAIIASLRCRSFQNSPQFSPWEQICSIR